MTKEKLGWRSWIRAARGVYLVLVLMLTLAGCAALTPTGGGPQYKALGHSGLVSAFLNLKHPEAQKIWIDISSIELLSSNGTWTPLSDSDKELSTGDLKSGQAFLGRAPVPPGIYTKVRLLIKKTALVREGEKVLLALPEPTITLSFSKPLEVKKGDSICIFITWDVGASTPGTGAIFKAAMSASPQSMPLMADLAYVACPDINTVYLIRTDRNWVYGAIGVSGGPTYMDAFPEKNRLYVLASRQASIKVINPSTNQEIDTVQIPLTQKPGYMAVESSGRWAYVLDPVNDHLVKLDLITGSMAERVRVGDKPDYLVFVPDQNSLAVSSALTQSVLLVDASTLTISSKIQVGNTPRGMRLYSNKLYIAESGSNTVCAYDIQTGQISKRTKVGFGPRRIIDSSNHIYVANYQGKSISILIPSQLNVQRTIRLQGRPMEMATSEKRRWLYVTDRDSKGVWVIDLTSNRVASFIPLGTAPVGITVYQ